MRVLSWNVNGIRAVGRNGFFDWLLKEKPDVCCIQETKANIEQLEDSYISPLGYQSYWFSAQKPGYSGVAVYVKTNQSPDQVQQGIGIEKFDAEGRVITAFFDKLAVVNAYFPNSQREHTRLPYKLEFCAEIAKYCSKLIKKGHSILLCGDYNIAHREIDLANPRTNINNAGFLPQERAWMTSFLSDENGNNAFVDTFRHFIKDGGHYSWWSYRPGVRDRNIGWRIDYHCVNKKLLDKVKDSFIMPSIYGSDHCPVAIDLDWS
ncbi:MAG: exodeoxyribonuclease III [Bacteriovoracia bacterium]